MLDKMLRSLFIHYLNIIKHHKNKIMPSRIYFSLHVWGIFNCKSWKRNWTLRFINGCLMLNDLQHIINIATIHW